MSVSPLRNRRPRSDAVPRLRASTRRRSHRARVTAPGRHRGADRGPARADPGHRRRDGHRDPARPARRDRLPRRAVRRLAERPPGQQRPAHAHPARHHRRRSTASTSRPAPTSSRPTPSTPTRSRWPTTACRSSPTSSTSRPRGWRAGCADEVSHDPDRPRYVAGALGPTTRTASISPDVNDPAPATSPSTSSSRRTSSRPRPGRGRRRPARHRDDLRHAQRQGRHLRRRDALRGVRPPLAGHRLRHHHRRVRPHPLRPGDRGVLELGAARPADRGRAELRARRRGDASLRRRDGAGSPTRSSPATPTRGCPTPSASTTRRPRRPRRSSASSPPAGFVNLVGGCCGTTPDHIAAIAAAVDGQAAPRRRRVAARDAALGPGAVHDHRGQPLRQRRRADQHHRLRPVPQPDQGRRLRHRAVRRRPAGRERRAGHRRQHGRGHDRRRRRHGPLPQAGRQPSPTSAGSR